MRQKSKHLQREEESPLIRKLGEREQPSPEETADMDMREIADRAQAEISEALNKLTSDA